MGTHRETTPKSTQKVSGSVHWGLLSFCLGRAATRGTGENTEQSAIVDFRLNIITRRVSEGRTLIFIPRLSLADAAGYGVGF